ncbi:MAG: hypothetical protein WD029_09410 [Microthrixaceae bacterium]
MPEVVIIDAAPTPMGRKNRGQELPLSQTYSDNFELGFGTTASFVLGQAINDHELPVGTNDMISICCGGGFRTRTIFEQV